jgi:hypothetical protein
VSEGKMDSSCTKIAYLTTTAWDLIDGIMAADPGIVDLIFCYFRRVEIKVIDDWQQHAENYECRNDSQSTIQEDHMNY